PGSLHVRNERFSRGCFYSGSRSGFLNDDARGSGFPWLILERGSSHQKCRSGERFPLVGDYRFGHQVEGITPSVVNGVRRVLIAIRRERSRPQFLFVGVNPGKTRNEVAVE